MTDSTINLKTIDVPIVLSATEARQLSEKLLYRAWTEREQFQFTLGLKYAFLSSGDLVQITLDGHVHTIRLISIDFSLPNLIKCNGVSDRASLYTSNITGGTINYIKSSVTYIGDTIFEILDIPAVLSSDLNNSGYYIAAYADYDSWEGAMIYISPDYGSSWVAVLPKTIESNMGTTNNVLNPINHRTWDLVNTVTVTMLDNSTLVSDTPENLLALDTINRAVIGNEIIGYANATLVGENTYELSTLLRGLAGTEWAIDTHTVGERFIVLNTNLSRALISYSSLNQTFYFKAVTDGQAIEDATSQEVIFNNLALKPWSVVHLKGIRDASNNLTIDWVRRSRAEASMLWTPPLQEEIEKYEIDIVDNDIILRTISRTQPNYIYTAAEQIEDGLILGQNITVRVYQMSAVAGRGYVNEEIL